MEKFEVCVRVIIWQRNKILICKHREKGYYFFLGGHLEFGESIPQALSREIKEELGIDIKKYSFIGLVDNIYEEEGQKHHEINLVFDTKVDRIPKSRVIEETKKDHIEFILFDKKRFSKEKVLPTALQETILKWQKAKKFFWVSQIKNKTIFHLLKENYEKR